MITILMAIQFLFLAWLCRHLMEPVMGSRIRHITVTISSTCRIPVSLGQIAGSTTFVTILELVQLPPFTFLFWPVLGQRSESLTRTVVLWIPVFRGHSILKEEAFGLNHPEMVREQSAAIQSILRQERSRTSLDQISQSTTPQVQTWSGNVLF